MTLYQIYELINFIVRDNLNGKTLTVSEFTDLWNRRQLDYFQKEYAIYESNTSITDTLRIFKSIKTDSDLSIVDSSYFVLPSDYYHFSGLSYIDGEGKYYPFDMVTKDQLVSRKASFLTTPSLTYPVCYEFNTKLYLEPYSASLSFNFTYLRYPNDVLLDYYIDNDAALQYLSASQTLTLVTGQTLSNGSLINLGQTDWFLPSQDELKAVYDNIYDYGWTDSFGYDKYWTSTEENATTSFYIDFALSGVFLTAAKSSVEGVRPIRSFVDTVNSYSLRDVGPGGGWIFYIDGTTYYEVSQSDLTTSAWSNITSTLIGGTGEAIGDGEQNTQDIINQAGHTASAAKLCDDLSSTTGTYLSVTVESEWNDDDNYKIMGYILEYVGVSMSRELIYGYANAIKKER